MKLPTPIYILFALVLLATACAKKVTSPVFSKGGYEEDLSIFRPRYGVAVAPKTNPVPEKKADTPPPKPSANDTPLHINRQLDMVLDTIATRNKYIRYANGYRIQVYMGSDRKSADDTKMYVYSNYPELNPYMSFTAPKYMIRVGDFISRLDAERYHSLLHDIYPTAMIVNEKVDIRKAILIR